MTARLTLALLAAGGVLGHAAIAHACGGGGSDGGSSSGSSGDSGSSDSDSGSSSSSESAPPCVDATDVNGYRTCAHYGGWGLAARLPALSFELQTWSAQVDLADVDVGGTIHHDYGPDYNYRVVGKDLGGDALAVGVKARILGHRRGLYGGVEAGVAGVAADEVDQMAASDGSAMFAPRVTMLFTTGAVVGVERGFGRISLGSELMAGVRGVTVSAESHRGACETIETDVAVRGVVEARVRADVWLTPWVTVGAYAGRDVFGSQSTAGLGLGGHLRAFDGGR